MSNMKLGIVGLPNVGKSTLFNSLTKAGAPAENYPFCTVSPNIGIAPVPDGRLLVLANMYGSKKTVPAVVEFVDIAGLVKGASKGEGLGNLFLSEIRGVDAIVHVVRCFEDPDVTHPDGSVDPVRDIETIDLELIFSDLEIIDRRIAKIIKFAKNDKDAARELSFLNRLKEHLEEDRPARSFDAGDDDERELLKNCNLLTYKPVILAANIDEDDIADGGASNAQVSNVKQYAARRGYEAFTVCAKLEEELSELDEAEKEMFLQDLGIRKSGLDKIIKAGYRILGLISFLTAGEPEVRAWTIKQGTKAKAAAGKIHSDIERGFIRAEVIGFDELAACGSHAAAKEKGLMRTEGKDYVVQDGDVILFRFNV